MDCEKEREGGETEGRMEERWRKKKEKGENREKVGVREREV